MKLSRLFRSPVAIVAAAVILSGSAFAFAANIDRTTNYNGPMNAGQFNVTADGYQIDQIKFSPRWNVVPQEVQTDVTFTLKQRTSDPEVFIDTNDTLASPYNTNVKIELVKGTGNYTICHLADSEENNVWKCETSVLMNTINELNVVATSNGWLN